MAATTQQENYQSAVLQLREASILRQRDAAFADVEGHETVYVLDANVVEYYLHEPEENRSVGMFSFGHLLNNPTAAKVSDRLTVEYLLGGGLPGQRGPAYVSAKHWNEALGRADTIARDLSRHLPRLDPDVLRKLRGLTNPREIVETAKASVPEAIMKAVATAASIERRLKRAFAAAAPSIRPLEQCEFSFEAHDRVKRQDVSDWRSKLTRIRRERAHPASSRTSKHPRKGEDRNIEADAWTLSYLQSMYRENTRSCGNGRKLQFLLVTADGAIIEAVEAKKQRLSDDEGIPNFVRHPRVFSPILNMPAMMQAALGDLERAEPLSHAFERAERAINRILSLREDNPKVPEHLSRRLSQWSEAARELATLNIGVFAEEDELKQTAELLQKDEVLQEATDMLRTTIVAIRDDDLRTQMIDSLRRLASHAAKSSSAGRGQTERRRVPIKVLGVDLLAGIRPLLPAEAAVPEGEDALDRFLDWLAAGAPHAGRKSAIAEIGEKLQKDWDRPENQLLSACMYLALEKCESARDCADRCRNLLRHDVDPAWHREANYCFALASRFVMRTAADFKEAGDALNVNIANFQPNRSPEARLGVLRDQVERAALMLSASIRAALEGAKASKGADAPALIEPSELKGTFQQATTLLDQLHRILDDDYSGAVERTRIVSQLGLQLHTNILAARIFQSLLGPTLFGPNLASGALKKALARLEEETGGLGAAVPRIARIYKGFAAVLLRLPTADPAATQALLDDALGMPNLTEPDREEYVFLSAELAQPSATQARAG